MFQLKKTLHAFGGSNFDLTFKREIEQLDAKLLPLQQGLSTGGYALHDSFKVMVISAQQKNNILRVKAGIFYQGIISGCSCADDPSPTDQTNEYCEMLFKISRTTGQAAVEIAKQ